jgi:2-keto-3-deoxy-L-arabinonate dehydratase
VVPIAPTPFRRTATPTDSQSRVLDCLIDHGVDGICILANYSEQLSDDERNTLLDLWQRSRA